MYYSHLEWLDPLSVVLAIAGSFPSVSCEFFIDAGRACCFSLLSFSRLFFLIISASCVSLRNDFDPLLFFLQTSEKFGQKIRESREQPWTPRNELLVLCLNGLTDERRGERYRYTITHFYSRIYTSLTGKRADKTTIPYTQNYYSFSPSSSSSFFF